MKRSKDGGRERQSGKRVILFLSSDQGRGEHGPSGGRRVSGMNGVREEQELHPTQTMMRKRAAGILAKKQDFLRERE